MGKHSLEELCAQGFASTGHFPQPQAFVPPPAPVPVPYPVPAPPPVTHRIATATVMVNSDAAVAEVSYQVPPSAADVRAFQESEQAQYYGAYPEPRTFRGSGASKRERDDQHDPVTGEILAVARAYEELAARLFREARGRIKAQDSERRQRALRRTRQEWVDIQNSACMAGELALEPEQAVTRDGTPLAEWTAPVAARLRSVFRELSEITESLGTSAEL